MDIKLESCPTGYSAILDFENDELYLSFGSANTYNEHAKVACVRLREYDIYVVGGDDFYKHVKFFGSDIVPADILTFLTKQQLIKAMSHVVSSSFKKGVRSEKKRVKEVILGLIK